MNPRLRKTLRNVAHGMVRGLTSLTAPFLGGRGKVPILAYHRVCPLRYRKDMVYANVYPAEFERQMAYVKGRFDAITLTEYVRRAAAGAITGDELCITFDDGFRDNYLYALPILRTYRLTATFFLVTRYIGAPHLFPWMKIDDNGKRDAAAHPSRWLPLTWDEVREMMDYGMEFGTHTHTHRASLSRMTQEEAEREIRDCTACYREHIGTDPHLFSFPHGTTRDFDESHIRILTAEGYRAAVTTSAGRNEPEQELFRLKRLIVYENDTLREFRKKVHGAYDVTGSLQQLWLRVVGVPS
jgi:peptidoglycan/xylan/chitin deacetylase (PgdA/CDA1 family)